MSQRRRVALGDEPYDLWASMHIIGVGARDPCTRGPSRAELLRAIRTPEGPASLHLRVDASARVVDAEVWGDAAAQDWLLDRLPAQLGADDRPPRFEGKLGRLQGERPGVRMGRVPRVIDCVIGTVIRQRVAWRDAVNSERSLIRALGEPAPGPSAGFGELVVPPGKEQWATLGTTDLAAHGLERKRARTLLEVASRERTIERWAETLSPAAFGAKLELLRGIGPWTSGTVRANALGDADAVIVGDYEMPSMIAWALAGEARADDARMLELLDAWPGQRYRVVQLLWASGQRAPRFGHRKPGSGP